MIHKGDYYRVYFNNRNASKNKAWVIDQGVAETKDEILCRSVVIRGYAYSGFRPKNTPPEPKAFLFIYGRLYINVITEGKKKFNDVSIVGIK